MDSILYIQPNADWITHREGTQSYIQPNADWITHREGTQSYLYSLMQTGLHIENGLNPIYADWITHREGTQSYLYSLQHLSAYYEHLSFQLCFP
jgi:hypothetical protein